MKPANSLGVAHLQTLFSVDNLSEPRKRSMQQSTPPLRGVFHFSVARTDDANPAALQRAGVHALPTAAAPNTSSNSASIIVHARRSAAGL